MTEARLPTGTVTFLFTDIEGSTRLVQDPHVDHVSVLEDHDRLMRDSITGGVEVSTEGEPKPRRFARKGPIWLGLVAGLRLEIPSADPEA